MVYSCDASSISRRMKHRLWWLRQRSSYLAWNGNGIFLLISCANHMCELFTVRRRMFLPLPPSPPLLRCVFCRKFYLCWFYLLCNRNTAIWRDAKLQNAYLAFAERKSTKWMRITTATSSWRTTTKNACKRLANGAHYSSFIKCTGSSEHTVDSLFSFSRTQTLAFARAHSTRRI